MVAQQLEGFHNDIVYCAVMAFSIATLQKTLENYLSI